MIYIGLDVSKISTALYIGNNNDIKMYSYTTKKENNIWIKKTRDFINYRFITYNYDIEKNYSKSELTKIKEFDNVTDMIINDILDNINLFESCKIRIEGYSYSSKKGPIIDIVEFTSILKQKLLKKLNDFSDIEIISPLTLKTDCCKLVYKPRIETKVGKRKTKEIIHIENNNGKIAKDFDKWDMFHSFIDSNINLKLKEWCKENLQEIEKNKDLFKPMDDIVDAIFLGETIKLGKLE